MADVADQSNARGADPGVTGGPSQAEGERDPAEMPAQGGGQAAVEFPSQAEGERETVEADIRQKEAEGKL